MQRSSDFSSLSDDQDIYSEYYRTSSSTPPFQQTQLPPSGFQWGRRSTQEVVPAGLLSETSNPGWIAPRLINGTGSATSAQPPNQRINQHTHYSSSGNAALFSNFDPFPTSHPAHLSNIPRQDINPQVRYTVGLTNQTRPIPRGDQYKVGSPRSSTAEPLICKWEGCTQSGVFGQKSSLIRHLSNVHVSPSSHKCPFDDCNKVCKRPDNLTQHIRNRHAPR